MGDGLHVLIGAVLVLWGGFVVAFPRLIAKWLTAAEKAGLVWNPQARWGSAWIRLLGGVLGIIGLVLLALGFAGTRSRDASF